MANNTQLNTGRSSFMRTSYNNIIHQLNCTALRRRLLRLPCIHCISTSSAMSRERARASYAPCLPIIVIITYNANDQSASCGGIGGLGLGPVAGPAQWRCFLSRADDGAQNSAPLKSPPLTRRRPACATKPAHRCGDVSAAILRCFYARDDFDYELPGLAGPPPQLGVERASERAHITHVPTKYARVLANNGNGNNVGLNLRQSSVQARARSPRRHGNGSRRVRERTIAHSM